MENAGPIFIVGAPRSGTSLLRNMLNRHPSIGICDETYFFYYVYSRRKSFGRIKQTNARRYVVERYLETHRIKRLGLNIENLSRVLMDEGNSYESLFKSLIRFYAKEHGKVRFGEKTPQNALFSDTMCNLYPDCKLVHIVRDPRDVVASLFRMPWGKKSVFGNTRVWLSCIKGAEKSKKYKNYFLVRYEDLVTSPEAELKRLCAFIGEKFTNDMLLPDKNRESDKWWFERAKKNLSKGRIGLFRDQLNQRQISLVERIANPYMKNFGYKPEGQELSNTFIFMERVKEGVDFFRNKVTRFPRLWYFWFQPTNLAAEEAWIDKKNFVDREKSEPKA